jgi:restriction system protein
MSYFLNQPHVVHAAYSAYYEAATTIAIRSTLRHGAATNEAPQILELPSIMLQAVIELGDRTKEGALVRAVAIPWFAIIRLMQQDPRLIYELDPRKWEELVAGAWRQEGYDVILTPRSGDGGKDVIATLPGVGRVRLFDQVKRYGPTNLVTADEVRSMLGVLEAAGNVSKGIITTTSDFAPGIAADQGIQRLIPHRLELKAREELLAWLERLTNEWPAR